MTSISFDTVLTILYVLVDDWYKIEGKFLVGRTVGVKPRLSDSEMLTLMLAQDFVPYPGETQYLGFIRANYLALFPQLLDQSQYNRRARRLRGVVEPLRRAGLAHLGVTHPEYLLLDTKPVPVVGYNRNKSHSEFLDKAAYGYCSARKLRYFGYKLTLLSTLDGIPVVYDLVPADTDERLAVNGILEQVRGRDIFADKGFIGQDWQDTTRRNTENRIWTSKRANQSTQNPPLFDRLLNSIRERVEGVFHCIQNTGRNLERLLAKREAGLHTRVALKITSYIFRLVLNRQFGVNIQTFSISH